MKTKFFIISGFILLTITNCDNQEGNISPLTNSWEIAVPNQNIPEGLSSLSAKECGKCHVEHYQEWKLSTHAHAWTDPQFQSELKKESSPFLCINCHTPLQNQQEYIINGLIDGDIYKPVKKLNSQFDENLQKEGINCASCHVRNNVIIGTNETPNAPHKTIKDVHFLSEQLCISCHNATAVLTPTLACTFETGDEWKSGPYFNKKTCISCHMEPATDELTSSNKAKTRHLHFFAGSGIPKFDSIEAKSLNGLGIYPSTPNDSYSLMDSIIFSLKLKNEFAGHNIPTGDPERFIIISFILKNKKGEILSNKYERIGEKWEWHPKAIKLADNNLTPNEERLFTFSYKAVKKDLLTLFVKITKHRLDQESADYNKLQNNYPLFITVFDKKYLIEIK